MNAIAIKPQARKTSAKQSDAKAFAHRIAVLKQEIEAVTARLQIVADAIGAAEYGSEQDNLMLLLMTKALPDAVAPLHRQRVTNKDLLAAYEGLLLPLALIKAVLSLTEGKAYHPMLQQEYATLDDLDNKIEVLEREDLAPHANPDDDFNQGRDLAIALLQEAYGLRGREDFEPRRENRDGKAQNRFALPYLKRLITEPRLQDGFAAVLSAALGIEDGVAPDYFKLPRREYEAGEVEGTPRR